MAGIVPLERPYLILLDLNMPCMNGFEFLEHLEGDARLEDSIVFVLTTSEAERDRRRACSHGIAGDIVESQVRDGLRRVPLLDPGWHGPGPLLT